MSAFSAMGGSSLRIETGSHVDVSGFAVELGVAKGFELGNYSLVVGGFAEYGKGSYDSFNSFANASNVTGHGKVSYVGGGVLSRLDLGHLESSRAYFEASLRAGKAESDFNTEDISHYQGDKLEMEQDGLYFGAHVGVGYVITEGRNYYDLDLSLKYFYSHLEGDEVMLSGMPLVFSDVDSHRIRAGGRISYPATRYIRPYFGAFYEYEFQGNSEVTLMGRTVPQPSLSGSTGIGELGISFSDSSMPLKLDLGLQGYLGKKEGIGGSMRVTFAF
jgi:outer membrane autotransporter protein